MCNADGRCEADRMAEVFWTALGRKQLMITGKNDSFADYHMLPDGTKDALIYGMREVLAHRSFDRKGSGR